MSDLAKRIEQAVADKKVIRLEEDNGTQHYLTATGNHISIINGKNNEYIQVENAKYTIIYNLDKFRSILIN